MENFIFYSPTCFVFGREEEKNVGKYIRRYGGNRVLIHYGGGSCVRSGLLELVRNVLRTEGITFVELGGVKPNPRSGLVYEGIELCRREQVDFILAVGGGSVIDSAKAIAGGVPYEGDFWDHHMGTPVTAALPIGTILTIAAAGSEGSPNCVITKEEGLLKRGTKSDLFRPKFSIMNPALTQTLSAYQTASGATDICAHLLERYFTDTKDVVVTDRLLEGLLLSMIEETPKVIANPNDYEARANIMWAGMLAHNNVCGVGRTQDWGCHKLEHELSALYDCAHGAGLAVAFPAWMYANVNYDLERFVQLAERVWGYKRDEEHPENTAKAGIDAFKHFFASIGMPVTLGELGAKEADIDYLAHTACFGNGNKGTVGAVVPLDEKAVKEIYYRMI